MATSDRCQAEVPDHAAFCPWCGAPRPIGFEPAPLAPADAAADTRTVPRRRRWWIWVVLGTVFVLVAVAATVGFVKWRTGGQIDGTLLSMSTNRPIAGATVRTRIGVAETDAAGHFSFSDIRPGAHAATVTVPGFAPLRATLVASAFHPQQVTLRLPDATVHVTLGEVAVQAAPIVTPTVFIGGKQATLDASGTYLLRGVAPTATIVRVTAPGHDATQTTVQLAQGDNEAHVALFLTPAETYNRYFSAFKAKNYSAAYEYLHPDVASKETLATFTKDMQAWGTPLTLNIAAVRTLGSWTSPFTGVTYRNVVVIDRTITGQRSGVNYTSRAIQHWANTDGLWQRVDMR